MTEEATPGRWKAPLAMIVMVLAGVLALSPPQWVAGEWPTPLTDEDHLRGLTATLHIQAEQLDAYRVRHGRLPGSLAELELPSEDIRYVRSNNRVFQLVATGPDGRNLVYDSAQPAPDFKSVAGAWIDAVNIP